VVADGAPSLLLAADASGQLLVMRLGNGLAAIADAGAPLGDFCARVGLGPAVVNRIEVIFEEVIANIVRHGFAPRSAQTIRVSLAAAGDAVVMVFEDDGTPFDPTAQAAPPAFTSLADAQIGGLGVALVRRLAQSVAYQRLGDGGEAGFCPVNRLTVTIAATAQKPAGQ
jgi:anti-sigma regulatory factor (Ser/Thr protein kinase)